MNAYEIDELLNEFDEVVDDEFSISDHTYENNTTIDQLTVEENTEEDIIADDLQIRDDIVLGVQEKKKRSPKTWKKNFNKILRMEVIAVDIDPAKIQLAKHNALIYGVFDKIEFVVADFFKMLNQIKGDVIGTSPIPGKIRSKCY